MLGAKFGQILALPHSVLFVESCQSTPNYRQQSYRKAHACKGATAQRTRFPDLVIPVRGKDGVSTSA